MPIYRNSYFSTIFVFPFKYHRAIRRGKTVLSPDAVAELLDSKVESKGWHRAFFAIEELGPFAGEEAKKQFDERRFRHYAEWHYFHPWVRETIFDRKESDEHPMRYLTRNDYQNLKIDFGVESKDVGGNAETRNSMTVRIRSIDLHLYANQIGLLTITTDKDEGPDNDFEAFLRFNDAARRVYPPFLAVAEGSDENTSDPKAGNVLPGSITLSGTGVDDIPELFGNLKMPQKEPYLSNLIRKLLNPLELEGWNDPGDDPPDKNAVYYEPFTDDRMFMVSYCINPELSEVLKTRCCGQYDYETSSLWYSYMFADSSSSGLANNSMKQELIRNSSYARFIDKGTLFGMTRYSFVALSNGVFKPLQDHMKSMYYQMALIVLFQRAMLWKFSQDVKEATRELEFDKQIKKAVRLNSNFVEFTNRYWHSEVTPQEQGIEIYNQWTKLLEHDRLYDDVHAEIEGLATIVRIQLEENRRVRELRLAAVVRTLTIGLLILSVWLVIFGEGWDKLPWPILSPPFWKFIWWLKVVLLIAFAGSVIWWPFSNMRGDYADKRKKD